VVKATCRAGEQGEIPNRRVVNLERKAIPMKNAKRMMAVIAASGLALGSMPGIANAQGSAELGVNLGAALGSGDLALDLAVDLGSEASDLPTVDELPPSSLGELTEPGGSLDPDTGSLAELTEPGGSLDPDTGSLAELTEPGGSLDPDTGSLAELTEPGGSLDPDTGSLAELTEPGGSLDPDTGSLAELTEPGGSLDPDTGSLAELTEPGGSLTTLTGSLTELTEPGGSLDPDTGSLAELTEPGGSLTTLTGSLTELTEPGGSLDPDTGLLNTFVAGSVEAFEAGSSNLGSNGTDTDIFLGSDAAGLATIGSLAVAGIGIGLAVSGGVNLPPLPEINVGLVCNLPQEGIDFLKSNGSMEQDECEPVEEQN
jgi:hypothetical protein